MLASLYLVYNYFLHSYLDIPRRKLYTNLVNGKCIETRFQNRFTFSHIYINFKKIQHIMFVEEKEKRSQSLNGCTLSMSHCGFVILLTNILVFLLSSTWLDYISPSCLDRSLMWPCDLLWSRCGSRCNTSLLYHSL